MSNLHKLNSTSIKHIDYHDDKDTLEIKFAGGAVYHYPGCDKKHYEALKTAASAGNYFHNVIKGMQYKRMD